MKKKGAFELPVKRKEVALKAKQRDGPRLVKKMLIVFAHGLLIDIAIGAIFLGLGALLFGPTTDTNIVKAVFILGIGIVCIVVALFILIIKAILLMRSDKD